jgi:hypothetical protein
MENPFIGIKVPFCGKKQDKLGRWRSAKVPDYSKNPLQLGAPWRKHHVVRMGSGILKMRPIRPTLDERAASTATQRRS